MSLPNNIRSIFKNICKQTEYLNTAHGLAFGRRDHSDIEFKKERFISWMILKSNTYCFGTLTLDEAIKLCDFLKQEIEKFQRQRKKHK